MNLEDHVGDILRKARLMTNVTVEATARATGLLVEEMAALEDSGKLAKRPDFGAVAKLLKLDAARLEGIAVGWWLCAKRSARWPLFNFSAELAARWWPETIRATAGGFCKARAAAGPARFFSASRRWPGRRLSASPRSRW